MSKQTDNKFQYTTEWQYDLLKYITTDRDGYKALIKIQDDYFTLIEHQIIALSLKDYYKKNIKVPGETILREEVIRLMNSREFSKLITREDENEIMKIIPTLYNGMVKDGEEIYNMCKKFSSFMRLKKVLEDIDPRDWEQYNQYAWKFQIAIEDEDEQLKREESFLFRDVIQRQIRRNEIKTIVPTPFRQINEITNAWGYEKGSIIVILDKQKKGKTTMLINVAKGYVRMGKKVLYLDLENGKDSIFSRFEQTISNSTKDKIISGEMDQLIRKKFRKYKRIGGEVVVERIPTGTDTNYIQHSIIDKYYREYGIKFDIIIVDYAAKMGSRSKKKDDTERISDVYNDLSDLALKNNIDHLWTANHVTREGAKSRMKTRYQGEDIAKCIDIVRHVHAIFGLNRAPEEEEEGYLRMELVEQRDGKPFGRGVFLMNYDTQTAKELTKQQRDEYDKIFSSITEEDPKERKTKKEGSGDDFK